MSQSNAALKLTGFGATSRPDSWWVQPLLVFLGFSAFIVYSTWAVLFGYGVFAVLVFDPATGDTVAVVTNEGSFANDAVARTIAAAVLDGSVRP